MALQLGALRDALIGAGVSDAKAVAAEVAGYESRLTTMVQAMIAIGTILLASQGAIWLEIGKIGGFEQVSLKIDRIARPVSHP